MNQFINFKKRNNDTYGLKIMGAIGDWWDDYVYDGNTIDTTIRDKLNTLPPEAKNLEIYINSPGGSVTQGISIYNQLRESGLHITTYNLGETSSIASIIFLAGHTRVMPDGTFALIHQPSHLVWQNVKEAEQHLQQLRTINESLKSIYLKHMSITSEELDKMLENETILNNDDAIRLGFATSKNLPSEYKVDSVTAYADRLKNTQDFLHVQKNLCLTKRNEIFDEDFLMTDTTEILQAKLQAAEARAASIEKEFKDYKESNPSIDKEALTNEVRAAILKEFKALNELKTKAINIGFKAEGDTIDEVMKNILTEGGISEDMLNKFDSNALIALCDYVMLNKKQDEVNEDYSALADNRMKNNFTNVKENNIYASLNKVKKGK